MRKRDLAPLSIIVLAFGLRMINLQSRPLWYDEAFSILYARLSPARMIQGTVAPTAGAGAADVHPLLYYFSLHGWMRVAGDSPLSARFLSVALGILTVAVLWRLTAWAFGQRIGVAVGLLGAMNPFHVAYSQETRMYALLGLAAVTAVYGMLRALQAHTTGSLEAHRASQDEKNRWFSDASDEPLVERWKWWAVYVVGASLTLYTHNLGGSSLLAPHVLALTRREWRRHLPELGLVDLIVVGLFSPWLIAVLPGQLGFVGGGYWLTRPGPSDIVRAVMMPVLTFYEPAPMWLLGLGLFTSLTILALLVLHALRAGSRVGWFLLLSWMPIVVLLTVSRWQPLFLERALLPAGLFYLVALAWLLSSPQLPRLMRWGLVVLLSTSVGASLINHYSYVAFPRPPFREAAAHLRAHVEPGDIVVHTNKLTYFPMHIYAPQLPAEFIADPAGSPQDTLARPTQEALGLLATSTVSEAVGTANDVWLVYFPREIEEAQSAAGEHPSLAWIEKRFVEIEQEQFADLMIALYREEDA